MRPHQQELSVHSAPITPEVRTLILIMYSYKLHYFIISVSLQLLLYFFFRFQTPRFPFDCGLMTLVNVAVRQWWQ